MMYKESIDEINKQLNNKKTDERIKPLIKLYLIGKLQLNQSTIDDLQGQIDMLCSRISNVEFSDNAIVAAYTKQANVLTVGKRPFMEGRAGDSILPVFMKFESALNNQNRRAFANNIEDFIMAGRIAKACNAPISKNLYTLYEMCECIYGDIEHKVNDCSKDKQWMQVCSIFNIALNRAIIIGNTKINGMIEGVRLFYHEVFDKNANEKSDSIFKTEVYQRRASKIIAAIRTLGFINNKELLSTIGDRLKLFTGCNEQMIENASVPNYNGNEKIGDSLRFTIENETPQTLTEDVIVDKVKSLIDRKPGWDNRISHLIIPYFIRSQKVFRWSFDEFQERLNEFELRVNKIQFYKINKLTRRKGAVGLFEYDTITLGIKHFFSKNGIQIRPIATTVFHESGHITDRNCREGFNTKLVLQKEFLDGQKPTDRFYEWTNSIFECLIGNNPLYLDNALLVSKIAYNPLKFLGSMLSSALGISELDYALIKDKGLHAEKSMLDAIFPKESEDTPHGHEIIGRCKEIFNEYCLYTKRSFGKKIKNQKLLNEMHSECIQIIKRRIENEIKSGEIKDIGAYKKRQMYFLRKINYNYNIASIVSGFIFNKKSITYDIGFCTDTISQEDLVKIGNEFASKADFDFKKIPLERKETAIVLKKKKSFIESLRDHFSSPSLENTNSVVRDEKSNINRNNGATDFDK